MVRIRYLLNGPMVLIMDSNAIQKKCLDWYIFFGSDVGAVILCWVGVLSSFLKTLLPCFGSARRSARLSRAQTKTKAVEWDSVEWEHYVKVVEWDSFHETPA